MQNQAFLQIYCICSACVQTHVCCSSRELNMWCITLLDKHDSKLHFYRSRRRSPCALRDDELFTSFSKRHKSCQEHALIVFSLHVHLKRASVGLYCSKTPFLNGSFQWFSLLSDRLRSPLCMRSAIFICIAACLIWVYCSGFLRANRHSCL